MKYLADVNILIALTDNHHIHHDIVMRWFDKSGNSDWGVCAFTEAGYLRVATNPRLGSQTVEEATAILADLAGHPGFHYWPMLDSWVTLAAPFGKRVFGHQQITDTYLLGLAVSEKGVLVTMDKAIKFLAGPQFSQNVLVLE